MNWIKTTEKLPEKEGYYIVTCQWPKNNDIDVLWFEKNGDDYECLLPNSFSQRVEENDGYISFIPQDNVIAWMPFPEPYNPDKD